MTTVRAKFNCISVTNTKDGATVKLSPVINGSDENKEFYRYTPGGEISLSTINTHAAKQFIPGSDYYVDFTPAE